MSSLGSPNPLLFGAAKGYEIERSLRFNSDDSAYLTWDPSSAGSRRAWTFSFWAKISKVDHQHCFFSFGPNSTNRVQFMLETSGKLNLEANNNSSSAACQLMSSSLYRDTSAWYHIVVKMDTEQSTASNRTKIFVNGVDIVDQLGTVNYPAEDDDLQLGLDNGNAIHIGKRSYSSNYLQGYMAEFHYIDGTALDADSFGETDSDTGQWIPKEYEGSHGSNGCYLKFSDNSGTTATTLGKDSSGNGNNWTPNNFSVAAGTGCDSMIDTPTNNFATLNSLENGYGTATYSNGNLEVAASNAWVPMRGSMAVRSGKYYWEVYGADGNTFIGVAPINTDLATINPMLRDGVIVYYGSDGKKRIDGTFTTYGSAYGSSNVIGVALDIDNGKLYFSEDNTWQNSGDPTSGATGTGAINLSDATGLVGSDIIPFFCKNGTQFQVNFGQRAFTHTPPTGYETLCSTNLPVPAIKNGKNHFNIELYTGNDSDGHARTGLGFQPNLVWIKDRGDGNHHRVYDSVRGVNAALLTSDGNAEDQYATYGQFESFDSDGFTVGIGTGNSGQRGEATNSAEPHVAWCWKESPSAGFDIVSYEGNGSGPRTISHNLGVKPHLIICKNREQDTNWMTYHKDVGAEKFVYLNTDAVEMDDAAAWNDTEPTETVFTVNADQMNNGNGDDIIAYVFTSVEGFSSFGVYEGNGATDGTFVYTGFRPSLVILKRVETTPNAYWNIYDSARDPYNSGTTADFKRLLAHSSGAEVTNHANYTPPDLLSNGFKLRHGSADKNYSGKKFIYLAFAETPFKYANAR